MKKLISFPVLFLTFVLTGCAASVPPTQQALETPAAATHAVTTASSTSSSPQACAACSGGQVCQGCAVAGSGGKKVAGRESCTSCVAKGDQVAQVCTRCPGDKTAPVHEPQPNVATVKGKGVCCQMCGAHAQKRIGKLDGVEWVDINLATGDITVGLSETGPRPDAEALRQAVREGGFTPGEVTLPEPAQAP